MSAEEAPIPVASLRLREMDDLSSLVGLGTELKAANGERFLIRRATLEDGDGLCRVCLMTGNGGKDATGQFKDPLLLGRRWVMPYVELEPHLALCLVSMENGEICGYALGCRDTIDFSKRLNEEYLPRMQKLYPRSPRSDKEGDIVADSEGAMMKDDEVIEDFYSFELPPEQVHLKYPSHMHIDLVPRGQGMNLGRFLLGSLLHTLRENGANMIHLEMWITNERAGLFYRRCGFQRLQEIGTNAYLGLDAMDPQTMSVEDISRWMRDESDEGMTIARLLAIRCNLLDWHDSHIRTGERYSHSLAMQAFTSYEKFIARSTEEVNYDEVAQEMIEISSKCGNLRPLCGSCLQLMKAVFVLHGRNVPSVVLMLCVLLMSLLQAQASSKAASPEGLAESISRLVKRMNIQADSMERWRDSTLWEAVLRKAASLDADPTDDLHAYPGYLRFFYLDRSEGRELVYTALFDIILEGRP